MRVKKIFRLIGAVTVVLIAGVHACGQGLEWSVERVDPGTPLSLPRGSALALASDGTPHAAYYYQSASGYELRHALKSNGTWLVETVDTFPRGGDRAVLSVDSHDRLHIVYNYMNRYGSGGQVRYGVLGDSGWELQDVNSVSISGRLPNMTLDGNDQPHLTFIDNGGTLFASHYATFDGQSWVIETVGPTGLYGFTGWDVAVNADTTPSVAGRQGDNLYVATRSTTGVWSLDNMGRGGHDASITLDVSGNPMIGHAVLNDDDLRFARNVNGTWTNEVVLHLGPGAKGPSLALDADGKPRMTFETDVDSSGRTLVHHAYLQGDEWVIDLVDLNTAVQSGTSLVVDTTGVSHVVYSTESLGVFYATAVIPEPAPLEIVIDIKPGSDPNSVNLGANGVVPVAIFGAEEFDVNDVDRYSLVLEGASPREKGKDDIHVAFEYINDDLFLDIIVQFSITGLELEDGAMEAALTGSLLDGTEFVGIDAVRLVGGPTFRGDVHGIPEPASASLLLLGAVALMRRRRRT